MRPSTAAKPVAAAIAVAGLLGAVTSISVLATDPALAQPIPDPVTVEEVVPPTDELLLLPAVAPANPGSDGVVTVAHRLVNGTDRELRVALSVREVDPATGAPTSDPPTLDVILPADEVQLAPDEAASFTSVASDIDTGAAYAVVGTALDAGAEIEISSLVLAAASGAEITIREPLLTTDRLAVLIDVSQGPVLVDAAVRLRNWAGRTIVESQEPDLVAWSSQDPLVLGFSLRDVALPGPYEIEVAAATDTDTRRTSATVWLFPETTMTLAAAGLVAVTGLAVAAVLWRRRRRRRAASTPADHDRGSPNLTETDQEDERG